MVGYRPLHAEVLGRPGTNRRRERITPRTSAEAEKVHEDEEMWIKGW